MENLNIRGERSEFFTPHVNMDAETGKCEISGESYLEYTGEFYDQIISWLNQFITEVNRPLVMNFRLTYFNTSSFKAILNLLNYIKKYEKQGGNVLVNWYYPEDDYDMLREAEDLSEGSGLNNMILIPYSLDD